MARASDEQMTYVQLDKEAPGLPEIGAVALRMFCRWGGTLLYNDVNSQPNPPDELMHGGA